jgi:hypothetical protein
MKKRRRTLEQTIQKEKLELEAMREELKEFQSSLHQDEQRLGGLHTCTACQSKDEDYKVLGDLWSTAVTDWQAPIKAESSLATTAEQLSEQGKLVQKLANDIGLLEKQVKRSSDQATQSAGAVKRQMAKALEARVREKETRANTVALETYKGVVAQLELATRSSRAR